MADANQVEDLKTQEPPRIEVPSGKNAAGENFPVGSILLPRHLRPHVAIFYAFARAIDDIADAQSLEPEEKQIRLEKCASAVQGTLSGNAPPTSDGLEKAHAMRESLVATGTTARHCLDLISAFKQDAVKNRYATWNELIDYCDRSAAPVGRYLLDIHGESPALYPLSDALCNALQVINHLQDCGDDYRVLNRIYLPQEWMSDARMRDEDLDATKASLGLHQTINLAIIGTNRLLGDAARLPRAMKNRRLAFETAIILKLAEALSRRLSREDPLSAPVKLTAREKAKAVVAGLWMVVAGR